MEEESKESGQPRLCLYEDVVFCSTKERHDDELKYLIEKWFKDKDVEVDWEYGGSGSYRFQAWEDRPEGLPLVSLKWVGP